MALTAAAWELGPGQYIVGNSTSEEYANYGYAPYSGDVTVGCVLYNSSYSNLKNCRALGIRFCLPKEEETLVHVKRVTLCDHNIEPIKTQIPREPIVKGWNYVAFDKPQELDPEGTFISYTYVQTDGTYGICNWPDPAPGGFWTYLYNSDAGKWMWSNFSSYYGAVCIQLIVEADVPDYDVYAVDVDCKPVGVGQQATPVLYLTSNSKLSVNDFDYTLSIHGKSTSFHQTLTTPVEGGINQQFGIQLGYTVPEEAGEYPVYFNLTKVNGIDYEDSHPYEFAQKVFSRIVPRRSVVEELTGTGCGYCPRGWVGMEYLKKTYPDRFVGIAVHQYNGDDPMYCPNYAHPGFGGAPSAVIDRKQALDPYRGTGNGVDADFEYLSSIAPEVDVKVSGEYNEDRTAVKLTANIEFLYDCGKYSVGYALTADGIKGGGAFNQTNYYEAQSAAQAGVFSHMRDLEKFCSGGPWGKRSVGLTYNDVLLGSSYDNQGVNKATALSTKSPTGKTYTRSYTIKMPTGSDLLNVLDYEKVYAIAYVIDDKGHIVNAARTRVGEVDGIGTVLAPSYKATESYDLSGRIVSTPQSGIVIQRAADGSTRKILQH